MARHISDEERERARLGGLWLKETREARGFGTGTEFAEALGIRQGRLSSYENGNFLVDREVAARIAEVLGMTEVDVWLGTRRWLPPEIEDPDKLMAWVAKRLSGRQMVALARKAAPELMTKSPGARSEEPGNKPRKDTRTGERSRRGRQGEQSAV